MRKLLTVVLCFALAVPIYGDVVVKSGVDTNTLTVDANKNARVAIGISTRPTYVAAAGGLATTALYNISIESSAGTGFKLVGWCVGISEATAAALVTVTVQRRTTASSTGTLCAAEATSGCTVSKYDYTDANYAGVVRVTSTLGTAGAVLDYQGFTVGELGAGAADPPSHSGFCKTYGQSGEKLPTVQAGTANGLSINVSAPGAGGLAAGSISAVIIAE